MPEVPESGGTADRWSRERWAVRAAVLVGFVGLYVGGALWAEDFADGGAVSPWFPPAALSLALVVLLGARWAPVIGLAGMVLWAVEGDESDTVAVALAYATINALAFGLAGAYLRTRLAAVPPLTRLGDLGWFVLVGVVAPSMVVALAIVAIEIPVSDLSWSSYDTLVRAAFVGDAVAIVALTPALLTISAALQGVSMRSTSPRAGAFDRVDALMALSFVALPPLLVEAAEGRVVLLSLLPLAWAPLRRGMPAATLAMATWTIATVVSFSLFDPRFPLVDVQAFLLTGGALALASGAVVSERERGRGRLAYLALHDDVTGLPNQHRLMAALTDALARDRQSSIAVLVIKLRGLHQIQAGIGRETLDQLLISIADDLRVATGPDATLARLSPSRFVIMLDGPGARDAERIADALLVRLGVVTTVDGRELALNASIGVAYGTRDGDGGDVLSNADLASVRAAHHAAPTRVLFDAALEDEVRRRHELERGLREAIEHESLELAFQPIVDTAEPRFLAVEALARWTPPGGAPVSPGVFIEIAEERGLILKLGRWILREACRQAATWPASDGQAPTVSVNVSPLQLQDVRFPHDVRAALKEAGIPPSRLRLEVTESILLDDVDTAIARLVELRDLGVEAMLDDFGTGYSSLSWVQRLPISTLKIDRSFVRGLEDEQIDRTIVEATIQLAGALGLGVVAEGVETERQHEILGELGCTRMQGFLISRPLAPEDFRAWMALRTDARPA